MRILLVAKIQHWPGADEMFLQWGAALAQKNNRVALLIHDRESRFREIGKVFERFHVPIRFIRTRLPVSPATLFGMVVLLIRLKARVIHAHTPGSMLHAVILKIMSFGFLRVIYTRHESQSAQRPGILLKLEKVALFFCSCFCVPTEGHLRNSKTAVVIPDPVSLRSPSCPDLEQAQLLERKKIIERNRGLSAYLHHFWILNVAPIRAEQNHEGLLHVWNELSVPVRSKCVLFFIGEQRNDSIARRVHDLALKSVDHRQIIFLPPQKGLKRWIKASDLYLSLTERDPFALMPWMAAAGGLPLLLTEIPEHFFLKSFARWIKPSAPDQAARAIGEFVQSVSETGKEKYLRALWDHSVKLRAQSQPDQVVQKYLNIYAPGGRKK